MSDQIANEVTVTAQEALAHNAVPDAADMLVFMTLEKTPDAAQDAGRLMLQVQ